MLIPMSESRHLARSRWPQHGYVSTCRHSTATRGDVDLFGECCTLEALTQDRTRLMSRLKSLLTTQGVSLPIDAKSLKRLQAAHLWDGTPLPPGLQERLTRALSS
jgi:hypothetical protein